MARTDPLAEYNAKRDFKKTPEPAGKAESSAGGNAFIVQKHDATRLHWDLRLEVDGVMKSWAVTKGPSPDPDIKRLAVRTEFDRLSAAASPATPDPLLRETSHLLSRLSRLLGVVLAPSLATGVLDRLEAVPLSSSRCLLYTSPSPRD